MHAQHPPSGGGKNDIPNRLKRQFGIFNVPLPSVAAINGIFGRLVEGRFPAASFSEEVVGVATRLVPMTVSLWNRTQARMLPTPAKFHYLFNIRELSKVFQGVILASRDRWAAFFVHCRADRHARACCMCRGMRISTALRRLERAAKLGTTMARHVDA
jgi:hypothetical protein